jgi:scyllo-inositol 2-dehydrogenase (NADP+)
MIRAGLLGFGLAGRHFHAPLLDATGIAIAAVVSSRKEAVRSALPAAAVLDSDVELFARSDIDLVVIATPNHLHEQQARSALLAGKHVVIDKPMCASSALAHQLIELADCRRLMLAVFHNRRWDSDFLTLKKLLAEERLGALSSFQARWDRFRPAVVDRWRERDEPGSGVLYDLGSHLIDQALVLFGMPDWITADVFAQREGASASDGFSIQMAAGRARISLGASTLIADGGPRFSVHGSRGSYVKFGLDVQEAQLRSGMQALDPEFGLEPAAQWGRFTDAATETTQVIPSERGDWTQFYHRVRACIEAGTAAPVDAVSGCNVIRVIEAAMLSSRSGERVVLSR